MVLPHPITDTPTAISLISFDSHNSTLSLSDHHSPTLSDQTSTSLHSSPSHSPLHNTSQPASAVSVPLSNPTVPIPKNMVPSHPSIVLAIRKSTNHIKPPAICKNSIVTVLLCLLQVTPLQLLLKVLSQPIFLFPIFFHTPILHLVIIPLC